VAAHTLLDMGTYPFSAIDHVQLAMPVDGEDRARAFYGTLLGMKEVAKPPELAKRGGCWFECGPVQIHLGVEEDFRPARKAHPALRCFDYRGLVARLRDGQVEVRNDDSIPGVERCHISDPFGNRIELIAELHP
jgi:catechol 2,3-dioxygenase-like lactoylglutathione lyase family enzyme